MTFQERRPANAGGAYPGKGNLFRYVYPCSTVLAIYSDRVPDEDSFVSVFVKWSRLYLYKTIYSALEAGGQRRAPRRLRVQWTLKCVPRTAARTHYETPQIAFVRQNPEGILSEGTGGGVREDPHRSWERLCYAERVLPVHV